MSNIDVVSKSDSDNGNLLPVHELYLPLKTEGCFRPYSPLPTTYLRDTSSNALIITAGVKRAPSLNTLAALFSNLDETLQSSD